jgi:Zn-dependent metalloprotease
VRKTLASTGAAVLLVGLGIAMTPTANAESPRSTPRPDPATALARAEKAVDQNRAAIRASAGDEFTATRTIIDANGASHVRYNRTYKGLRVLGGDFVVHNAPGGAFAGASVSQPTAITVGTSPKLTVAQAKAAAQKAFSGKIDKIGAPELIVDASEATPRLAWEAKIDGIKADQTPSLLTVVVDASTGAVLDKTDKVKHVEGTGASVYSGSVTIDTTQSGGSYTLTDPSHGNGRTCDMNNGSSTCSTMTDADNAWGNGSPSNRQSAAVDAHFGAAKTFDYFKNVHGRNGIFGNGQGVPSRVHYGNGYVNAFWDGSQMTYGDGQGNQRPLVSLDVAGHEMSHGVTEALSNLAYSGDAGGLNEATSDIFGNMVEFYANVSGDPGDYDVGEKININGNGTPLRYMYHPSKDGRSFDCWSSPWPNGDPHYTSGPGNHFFFLLAEGSGSTPYGTSPTCNNSTVTGIGRDKAAKIWYRALDVSFTSTESYSKARTDTLAAATFLYGNCSTEYKAVQAAWSAVRVSAGDSPCTGSPSPTPTGSPTPSPTTSPGGSYFENANNVNIPDLGTGTSTIPVTRAGNAPSTLKVGVDIKHSYRGDLVIDLVAPDGTAYRLKNSSSSDSADNVITTYTTNASSEVANGTWSLRVRDAYAADTGFIDKWSLQF